MLTPFFVDCVKTILAYGITFLLIIEHPKLSLFVARSSNKPNGGMVFYTISCNIGEDRIALFNFLM
jgi:hypothetical protein